MLDYQDEQEDGFLRKMPPELDDAFNRWQENYRQIDTVRSYLSPEPGQRLRLTIKKVTQHSRHKQMIEVKRRLNEWLNSGDTRWQRIRDRLIAILSGFGRQQVQIPLLLDTDDVLFCRLPWQEWSLFESYGFQSEIALRVRGRPGHKIPPLLPQHKVRILVVVGRSDGIQTQADLAIIQTLRRKGAEVISLIEPTLRQLCEALWDRQGYHIFVFTGHSGSHPNGQIGWIELNETDSLSIEEFKHSFQVAIEQGLQLAIFNSCDGIGLANQLAKLNLPRSIVMREPVPDEVAVAFLQYFFEGFSRNESLFTALYQARIKLECFNAPQTNPGYPGVMWLPVLCTRESVLKQPFSWNRLKRPSFRKLALILGFGILGLGIALISILTVRTLRSPELPPEPSSTKNLTTQAPFEESFLFRGQASSLSSN